jgi:murein L,D-transpeptidase YafK
MTFDRFSFLVGLCSLTVVMSTGHAQGDSVAAATSAAAFSASRHQTVDRVVVVKSERKLYLVRDGERVREMKIALGLVPTGHKERSGDFKTPEGLYYLDARNPDSDYFLSIHVSYPNERDRARAAALGVDPGGSIMIHGRPNAPKMDERSYAEIDWTDGCIAVSNSDMLDIWLMTGPQTPIEILP